MWGGAFWEAGYFFRTVGEEVTADVIRRYIAGHSRRPGDGAPFGPAGQPGLFLDMDEES